MTIDKPTIIADTPEYLVVNKPSGLLAHPTIKNHAKSASADRVVRENNTLVDWLISQYPKIKQVGEGEDRAGLVHRLDREASGVMVVPKTQEAYLHLKKQFQDRTIEKEYIVLVHGKVARDHGVIDFAIDRGAEGRMVSRPKVDLLTLKGVKHEQEGREAVTEFDVEQRFTRFTLLSVRIHTGRTHQIRVHMLGYNHPVVGDTLYMNKKLNLKRDRELGRLFLHARKLCFDDLLGARVCYEAPLPEELKKFLEQLK